MKLDKDTRSMLRSTLVARGPTSPTDDEPTLEEYLLLALDDLDEIDRNVDTWSHAINAYLTDLRTVVFGKQS